MKMRKRRFKRNLIYYPAAGVVALSSFFGLKKPPKMREKDESHNVLTIGASALGSMRQSIKNDLHAIWKHGDTAGAPTIDISSAEPLQQAFGHLQLARGHWDKGEYDKAGQEADEVTRILAYTPVGIDPEKTQVRDELRMQLSQLVVDLNQLSNGQPAPEQVAAAPVGPLNLELNRPVEREIGLFQGTQRATFVQGYQRAGAHMPFIQKKIAEMGMPKELGWLPLIESGFKTSAKSQVKALGLWQFMPATGEQLGLERDRWIDERMNPEQASEAALTYLKYLHGQFGDWNKALAAYNYGEGNIRKVLRRMKRDPEHVSFWDMTARLPEETARYVPKFLAAVHIAQDPAKFGFENLDQSMPQRYESVQIEKQMDMDEVARQVGLEPTQLADLNPELLQRVTPPQRYSLRVPAGYGQALLEKVEQIPEYKPQPRLVVPSTSVASRRSRGHSHSSLVQQASARSKSSRSKHHRLISARKTSSKSKSGARQAHVRTARKSASKRSKRA